MNLTTFDLSPIGRQKSFYGKAKVHYSPVYCELQSYDTIVCTYDVLNGVFVRKWNGYSATTMRHINAFMEYLGFNVGGKHWWTSLPVGVSLTIHDILNAG